MGCSQVPEFDSASSSLDDNPFAGSRTPHTGKVSVKVPVDEWLCRKFKKLDLTVQEGYPSRSSETAGLTRDQFVKPPKTLWWICLPPDSTTNFHNLSHQFRTPRHGQWTHSACHGRICLPTSSHLGKGVEKLQDYPCNRFMLIALGWPNMPWFWDLVTMSSQIPMCLPNFPNLVTQPFNQTLHRNLSNLNLHAWLLELQLSRAGLL